MNTSQTNPAAGGPRFPRSSSDKARCRATSPAADCILWTGWFRPDGYGQRRLRGRLWLAHRLAYTRFYGPINPGYHILHSCDVKACVNPLHLRQGTNDDNVADKVLRNRQARGKETSTSKLTEEQVRAIRADGRTQQAIADEYGICHQQVSNIKNRKSWGWLT